MTVHYPGMNRRRFLLTSLVGTLTAPRAAEGKQTGKGPRVGVLSIVPGPTPRTEAFARGLHELGYDTRKTLVIEWRWAAGKAERFPEFARGLVESRVDVIVAAGPQAIVAASRATHSIPVVMVAATDPVRMGVITSLARPGGNVTGVAWEVSPDIVGKQVDWLKEVLPRSTRLGLLVNPAMPGHGPFVEAVEAAASKLGLHVLKTLVQSAADVESAPGAHQTRAPPKCSLFCPIRSCTR